MQYTNLHNESNQPNVSTASAIKCEKNFRPAGVSQFCRRACSHDAPKNFVLPLLEHHRLVGSCLVITRRRTGTTAILVVSERGVGARLGNIRSRKNTKCFADYSRAASTTQHRHGVFEHDRTAKVTWISRTITCLYRDRVI